jgi:dihydroneopterin aldolase
MSQIEIRGIRAFGHHGVLEQERVDGQEFIVDARLEVDTAAAERDDDVTATVHYGEVAEAIHSIVVGEPVNLIETLAARIADRVMAFERVQRVEITVHKPRAPIPVPFADVSVTIERTR